MKLFIWATEYELLIAHAETIEQAKEMILEKKQYIGTQLFDAGAIQNLDESDKKEIDKALKEDPVILDDKQGYVLFHGNE